METYRRGNFQREGQQLVKQHVERKKRREEKAGHREEQPDSGAGGSVPANMPGMGARHAGGLSTIHRGARGLKLRARRGGWSFLPREHGGVSLGSLSAARGGEMHVHDCHST